MGTKKLNGEATPEQIAEWKKKYGEIFQITADDKAGYIRAPKRSEVGIATSYQATNPFKSTEFILQNCWLGGADELISEDKYFYGLNAQLMDVIEVAETKIKKL